MAIKTPNKRALNSMSQYTAAQKTVAHKRRAHMTVNMGGGIVLDAAPCSPTRQNATIANGMKRSIFYGQTHTRTHTDTRIRNEPKHLRFKIDTICAAGM